jgi:glycosyltransferase involved in cell wall biosynthesis
LRLLSIQTIRDGGGGEHALIDMIRQLVAAGWECHVAIASPPVLAEQYAAAGAVLHIVPMERLTLSEGWQHWVRFGAAWPVSVWRLFRLARRLDVDVVHTNSLHSLFGWAVAWLARRPHVWHAREIVVQSRLALRVERLLARRFAVRVVAVSDAVAAQLDPANVVVILDEPDPARFRPDRAGRFRSRVGLGDHTSVVGSVARIDVWKGFDVLLDAWTKIRTSRPDAHLLVAGAAVGGKDEYAAGLARRAAQLGGVSWLGPRRDVAELMADLDAFVQVSTEPEPYGLVLVEALACGVPVVGGDRGGPVEIFEGLPPEAGRLVPAGDPDALADAVVAVLPAGPSSAAARAARAPLRTPGRPPFAELFTEVGAWPALGRRSSNVHR